MQIDSGRVDVETMLSVASRLFIVDVHDVGGRGVLSRCSSHAAPSNYRRAPTSDRTAPRSYINRCTSIPTAE